MGNHYLKYSLSYLNYTYIYIYKNIYLKKEENVPKFTEPLSTGVPVDGFLWVFNVKPKR